MRTPSRTPSVAGDYSVWDEESDLGEDGVLAAQKTLIVADDVQGERLDKWLATQLRGYSRNRLQSWIEAGAVRVNDAVGKVRLALWGGDRVLVHIQEAPEQAGFTPQALDLDVVYEDAALIVLNKPAGLVVHPAAGNWQGTLLNGLLHRWPELARVARAGIVHRLDKDTTGLLVVAKTEQAQIDLVRQLQARSMKREYLAVVHGTPPLRGTITEPIGRHPTQRKRMSAFKTLGAHNKVAITHYEVLEHSQIDQKNYALLLCRLETGRTHQIRVHLQALGFPLVGDAVYGRPHDILTRQALHAWKLELIHPQQALSMGWCVQPPEDFLGLLLQLDLPWKPSIL